MNTISQAPISRRFCFVRQSRIQSPRHSPGRLFFRGTPPPALARKAPHELSVRYVKGVGPRRMTLLTKLGIRSIEDAYFYAPRRYEDRTRIANISQAPTGELVTVRGRVISKRLRWIRSRQTLFDVIIEDGSGVLHVRWFNLIYMNKQIDPGDELVLYGRIEETDRRKMVHPEMELVQEGEDELLHMGRIVPVYPAVSGLSQRWFRQFMAFVLENHCEAIDETLPESFRLERAWPELSYAIAQLHFPHSWETLHKVRERLAYDELLLLQLSLARRRAQNKRLAKPQRYQFDGNILSDLRKNLPFQLTEGQNQSLEQIFLDLKQTYPMHRLLQGDVGCGKTIVMIHIMAVAVQSGYQVALMAPTELLAEQHYRTIRFYLESLGVSVGFLSQSVNEADKRIILKKLSDGEIDIMIGTHALIQKNVDFQRLSFVVIDEQHKFGVGQRALLAGKAQVPDVLVMTATPIPRTLALSLYGDLSISTITDLPPGRQPIKTVWLQESRRKELYQLIRTELTLGRQAYIVYPLVDENQTKDLKAAKQMARTLQETELKEFHVGLLHGKMKPKEKEETMRAFTEGEYQAIVSTVIVEVGLDVSNASIMVIEHPERFGLAQLHQLRGRIGRGPHPATCVLMGNSRDDAVKMRLQAFVQIKDGFTLADKDLELRGPGELLGSQQHGWLKFRIADLTRDRALLELAREQAQLLIQQDPKTMSPELQALDERAKRFRKALKIFPSN